MSSPMHDDLEPEVEVLSLDDTEPIELEEVETPPGYEKAARRHLAGRSWWRRTVDPLRGTGAE